MGKKLSNNEKAAQRLATVLATGRVVSVEAFWGRYTVGAYTPAVGAGGYVLYGYGVRGPTEVVRGDPLSAGRAAVELCGSTRVREAAIRTERAVGRGL